MNNIRPPNRMGSMAAGVDDDYPNNHPECFCCLQFESINRPISKESVNQARARRQPAAASASEILHDLLAASLVPLTETAIDPSQFKTLAANFLSCFEYRNTIWDVNVNAVPFGQATAIYGVTPNARNRTVQYRFQRFRFPFVNFEWHVETPYHEVNTLLANNQTNHPITVKSFWKAWTKNYAASAVIAIGSCTDTLVLCPTPAQNQDQNRLVISARNFIVTKVIQPELMKPIPYPQNPPPHQQPDFNKFATSQTVIQLLKGSQKRLAFLIAVSALATSVRPFADKNSAVGLTFTVIAIATAGISALVFVIGLVLKWIEGHSARYQN